MNLRLRLTLANDAGTEFFGRGLCDLLAGIDERGSIQASARAMGLSYVKALHILERVERELGFALVLRRHGGATRGGAELTPRAKAFLKAYGKMERSLLKAGERAFRPFEEAVEALGQAADGGADGRP